VESALSPDVHIPNRFLIDFEHWFCYLRHQAGQAILMLLRGQIMTMRTRKTILFVAILLVWASMSLPIVVGAESNAVHVVQRGETLGHISQRYSVSIANLTAANSIANPNLIYAGQRLVIPGAGNSAAVVAAPTTSGGSALHVVQRGENLFRIALQYNVDMNSIVSANNIANPNSIYAGQRLHIPGSTGAVTVAPAPAPAVVAPAAVAPPTVVVGKQIVIDLSEQQVYAYENGELLRVFTVSTGLPRTPTVQGDYRIYLKYSSQRMRGPGYDLPGVPWVMYFYQGYGLHGTYWHSNFGNPMSHGCVNMRTPEAEWMYNWAPMGTPVHVQA
jgi:lipoprotein-anchoring transpeptidase ErfK/SrfK